MFNPAGGGTVTARTTPIKIPATTRHRIARAQHTKSTIPVKGTSALYGARASHTQETQSEKIKSATVALPCCMRGPQIISYRLAAFPHATAPTFAKQSGSGSFN